jgi:hypothetical protein
MKTQILLLCVAMVGVLTSGDSRASELLAGCALTRGGDRLDRSFYIANYAGSSLEGVEVALSSDATHTQQITLTARLGAFDGPIIGSATKMVAFQGDESMQTVFYDYPSAPVPPGSTVAFSYTRSNNDAAIHVFSSGGALPCLGTVVETNGSSPPLDSVRRNWYGVAVFGSRPPIFRNGFEGQ